MDSSSRRAFAMARHPDAWVGRPSTRASTAKRRSNHPARISIHNLLNGNVHASHTNKRPGRQRRHAQPRHRPPRLERMTASVVNPGIIQPKRPRDTIGVPARKQTRGDADEVVEYRHANHQHKRRGIHQHDEDGPYAPAEHGMAVQMPTFAEEPHENQLGGRVRVQASGDEEVWNRDAVSGLLPFRGQAREGGRGNGGPDVDVQDGREDDIERGGERLQHPGRAHGVLGMLHLRDEDEEHEVARVRKNGVRDGDERGHEIRLHRYLEIGDGESDACADHADEAGYEDAEDGEDAEPG